MEKNYGRSILNMEIFFIIFIVLASIVLADAENTTMNNITVHIDEMNEELVVPLCLKVPLSEALQLASDPGQVNYTTITNSEIWTEEFINCTKISLTSNYLCAINHSVIFIPAYGLSYSKENYYLWQNQVYVCLHFRHEENVYTLMMNKDPVAGYLTIVGIAISNICLALHLFVFIVIPEMKNLSGSNLAALSVAIFCSYLFFVISQEMKETVACVTLFSFTLFFFLSSFLWMSVIGFETWSSLRMACTKLKLSTKTMERKKYRYYSVYAWLIPLILVFIVLILDASDDIENKFKPGIDREMKCWFTQQMSLILFFLLPLIMVMTSNLIFFLWSAFIIHMHTDRLKRGNFKSLIRKFSSYGKLAIVTGLTWITGIIAFAAKERAVWYIFIIFTTFHGLFIFVAFTCTKKVYRHLRKRFSVISMWIPSHSTEASTSKPSMSESKV